MKLRCHGCVFAVKSRRPCLAADNLDVRLLEDLQLLFSDVSRTLKVGVASNSVVHSK